MAAHRPLDIVVPVLNEEASVDELIARVERLGYADALIFVDNASTDGTVERIRRHAQTRLVCHARNEGYGASIRHGIAAGNGDVVVIMDGDLEYPPEALPAVLEALATHSVVYCSRFLGAQPPDMSRFRQVGNRWMSRLYNRLYDQQLTDLYTGMKGLRRAAVPLDALARDGFEHAAELSALVALAGHRIHEIGVDYRPRRQGASKMRHIPEALKLGFYIVAYRLAGRRGRGITSRV